jgi:hypothetical protein
VSKALPQLLLSVTHIGPRRARRLLDGLGDDWASVIDADPERVFATLRGLGRRRARVAATSWADARDGRAPQQHRRRSDRTGS